MKTVTYIFLLIGLGVLIAAFQITCSYNSPLDPSLTAAHIPQKTGFRKIQGSEPDLGQETVVNKAPHVVVKDAAENNANQFSISNDSSNEIPSQKVAAQAKEMESIKSRYQAETVDINWAQEQEIEIVQSLQGFSVNNPDLILNSVNCKSTICQLQFLSYDEKGWINHNAMENIVEHFSWADEFGAIMGDQGSSATMWIRRKEQER